MKLSDKSDIRIEDGTLIAFQRKRGFRWEFAVYSRTSDGDSDDTNYAKFFQVVAIRSSSDFDQITQNVSRAFFDELEKAFSEIDEFDFPPDISNEISEKLNSIILDYLYCNYPDRNEAGGA